MKSLRRAGMVSWGGHFKTPQEAREYAMNVLLVNDTIRITQDERGYVANIKKRVLK